MFGGSQTGNVLPVRRAMITQCIIAAQCNELVSRMNESNGTASHHYQSTLWFQLNDQALVYRTFPKMSLICPASKSGQRLGRRGARESCIRYENSMRRLSHISYTYTWVHDTARKHQMVLSPGMCVVEKRRCLEQKDGFRIWLICSYV